MLDPDTEQYQSLPLQLHHNLYGSISFIHHDKLLIFNYNLAGGTWSLSSQKSELDKLTIIGVDVSDTYTTGSPIVLKDSVYWINYGYQLYKLDLTTLTVTNCTDWRIIKSPEDEKN